jgi:hypothetical protein
LTAPRLFGRARPRHVATPALAEPGLVGPGHQRLLALEQAQDDELGNGSERAERTFASSSTPSFSRPSEFLSAGHERASPPHGLEVLVWF